MTNDATNNDTNSASVLDTVGSDTATALIDSQSNTATGTDSGTAMGSDTESDTSQDTTPDSGLDSLVEAEADSGSDAVDTGADTETQSDTTPSMITCASDPGDVNASCVDILYTDATPCDEGADAYVDRFNYVVTDGNGGSATALVDVEVSCVTPQP